MDERIEGNADNLQDPDQTIVGSDSADTLDTDGETGGSIGPYRLVRRLGEGGMGEVFLAEQTEPIRRTVALKVIKPGMDTRAVVRRFELERQTLALMDHPCIARVYDAGQTERGRPYFVMEYVDGVPITRYCDEHQLDLRQRLALIIDVCAGVQHAHQKAVIHRDLKPGNILITEVDGRPVPKIIDFGIARATDQREVERTMFTQAGYVVGTPAYMSPEQTDPGNSDIDTRTDIYSLGVVLYELLVGRTPFDTAEVFRAGYDAIMKFLREQEAPRPSVRLQQDPSTTAEVAARQATEPGRLVRSLEGDLDWILLTALEKDRNRRYATANALAMELQRYLNDEAVLASPPSATYQARKFVRRHRRAVTAGAVGLVVLLAFAVTTSLQNRVIAHERDRAELETAKATAINDFLRDMLVGVDPWLSGDHDLTVVEAMDNARADVDSIFADQPLVAAEMHATMGQTYLGLQKLAEAEQEVRRALELRTELLGPDHPDLADTWLALSRIQRLNNENAGAVAAARELVRLRELNLAPGSAPVLDSYGKLAEMYNTAGQFAAADSMLDMMQAGIATGRGNLRPQTATMFNLRGTVAQARGDDMAVADSLYQTAVDITREYEPGSADFAIYLNNLAVDQMSMGSYDAAHATYAEALALAGERFGTDHPEYALVLENLGGIAYRLGEFEDCLANLEKVRAIRAGKLGDDHPLVMRTQLNMGAVAMGMGDNEQAIGIFETVLPRLVALNGEVSADVATTLRNQGLAYRQAGRYTDALAAVERARRVATQVWPDGHGFLSRLDHDQARLLLDLERPAEAADYARRALAVYEAELVADDPRVVAVRETLAEIKARLGR